MVGSYFHKMRIMEKNHDSNKLGFLDLSGIYSSSSLGAEVFELASCSGIGSAGTDLTSCVRGKALQLIEQMAAYRLLLAGG